MKKNKSKFRVKSRSLFAGVILLACLSEGKCLQAIEIKQKEGTTYSYVTSDWNKTINQEEAVVQKYPDKRKITPETVRLTINEYYIPQFSELLEKGVDYFEWLNTLDDPYLNRYKVDVRVDPDDERLKLFWKRAF